MKILMYRWKAYNQQDIVENLQARGHMVEEIKGDMCNFDDDPAFIKKFKAFFDKGEYDLVFTVNYFPMISNICQEKNVQYIAWCCDSPLGTMYNQSIYNSVNKIFTFDKYSQMLFRDMGIQIYYLPLCGAIERVTESLLIEPKEELAEVAFVGSMYKKNSYDQVYDQLPEYLRGYFDASIKLQSGNYTDYMLDDILDSKTVYELNKYFILSKSEQSFSDLPLIFSTTVLGFKIAQLERIKILTEISKKHNVNVYTDDLDAKFVKAHNMGPVDYWKKAPSVFRDSKINLNLTIKNIRSGIPLRVWDILSAGGFCITNFQAELPFYFENKKDLVWFESQEELLELIKYYLEHEDERKTIAKSGYEKVKSSHRYKNRFDEMSKIVKGI